jgi:hypothetical protein
MTAARRVMDPSDIRQLCMVADWMHLKLLLYAIGSDTLGVKNVEALQKQWATHMFCFGEPLGVHPCIACPLLV